VIMLESIDVGPNPSDLDLKMKALVEAHEIDKARALLAATPGAEETHWGLILRLPTGKVVDGPKGRGDLPANMAWVDAHREEYANQWVALRYGELIAHAPTFDELLTKKRQVTSERALLTKVWP
jgi:Family of unknown function (DUF5678)